ncbi:Hypothetical predicted protein [Pelobates cultripes]|uniref:Uncharacterized protein n=1 Tax=Pelobates cultripes TaxID=61616 RepID=A0AAD1RZ30_PELCU|nr:Hypothetical predicted protein [Pelobates cultripes]
MESNYKKLKRTTLKELLESRGGNASNQPRRELIADLTELDQSFTMTEPTVMPSDKKTRIVRERLPLYGPNPSVELVQQLMAEAEAEAEADTQRARPHELSVLTAQHGPTITASSNNTELAEQQKIPFTAFKPVVENKMGID